MTDDRREPDAPRPPPAGFVDAAEDLLPEADDGPRVVFDESGRPVTDGKTSSQPKK